MGLAPEIPLWAEHQKFVAAAKLVLSTSSRKPPGWSLFIKEKVSIELLDEEEDSIGDGRKLTELWLNSDEGKE